MYHYQFLRKEFPIRTQAFLMFSALYHGSHYCYCMLYITLLLARKHFVQFDGLWALVGQHGQNDVTHDTRCFLTQQRSP